jgi:hypothetical protein
VARLAICTLLLVCSALPAAETNNLHLPGDAIEVVDFYARATVLLPTGGIQPNAEVRAGMILPGPITLHLRIRRHDGKTENVEWRMYRTPQTPGGFDTGIQALAVQANGDSMAGSVVQVQNGAYHISAQADPQNRLRETPRARTNNKRVIVLIAATSPPST